MGFVSNITHNRTGFNIAYYETMPKSGYGKKNVCLYLCIAGANDFGSLCYLQTPGGFSCMLSDAFRISV